MDTDWLGLIVLDDELVGVINWLRVPVSEGVSVGLPLRDCEDVTEGLSDNA